MLELCYIQVKRFSAFRVSSLLHYAIIYELNRKVVGNNFGFLESEKVSFGQKIWSNFGLKKSLSCLYHTGTVGLSSVNRKATEV